MKHSSADRLSGLIDAVKALPQDSQDMLVDEIEHRVSELTVSQLSDTQRDVVKQRLAKQRQIVAEDEVRDILRRYNPTL